MAARRREGRKRGESVGWAEVGARTAVLVLTDEEAPEGRHWYAVTVEAESVPRTPPVLAHASPFFVTQRRE